LAIAKPNKVMTVLNFTIVASDMVWQWYLDELGNKHVREIIGREAVKFIEELKFTTNEVQKTILVPKEIEGQSPYQQKMQDRKDETGADGSDGN